MKFYLSQVLLLTFIFSTLDTIGLADRVLDLDGNGDYADIPDSPSLSNLPQLTLEAWINPTVTNPFSNGIEAIISQYSSSAGQRAYFLAYHRTIDRIRVSINENTGGIFFDGTIVIPQDKWTHVAMTYDGSKVRIYVNKVLDTEQPVAAGGITDFNIPIQIGSQAGSTTNRFSGAIDEARIWKVARTDANIHNSMFCSPTWHSPNLVGYWRMNDNSVLWDHSHNGNTGTLVGDAQLIFGSFTCTQAARLIGPLTRGTQHMNDLNGSDASGNGVQAAPRRPSRTLKNHLTTTWGQIKRK